MTKPTPPALRNPEGQTHLEIGPNEARIFGDRSLPPTKRPPPTAMGIIHEGIREKSVRYHIAFWGALVGTPLGGLVTVLSDQNNHEIGDTGTYWTAILIVVVVELLLIRTARFIADNQLRKDLYCVYWRIVFKRYGLPAEKTVLISPAIDILSLVYGFYSLARIAIIAAIIGTPIAILFFPGFFVLILAIGGAVYGGIKLCQEMIEDSKWKRLETKVRNAAWQ
jgi:MFS family permease